MVPATTYGEAMSELVALRDRLSAGRAEPDDIEELAERAARAVSAGRAALRRGDQAIERLDLASDNGHAPARAVVSATQAEVPLHDQPASRPAREGRPDG